jgi:hypothetical protein
MPWSPAGHCAGMGERAGESGRAKEEDDSWGPHVSESERGRARVEQATRMGHARCWATRAQARASAGAVQWAVRLGQAEGGKEKSARFDFAFLFQNCE